MKSKICTKCKEEKPLNEFTTHKKGIDGKEPSCKQCRNKYHNKRYSEHKNEILAKSRASKRKYNIEKYGITLLDYEHKCLLLENKCEICGIICDRLNIDHDHDTNKVRGLLCNNCNWGLGHFKDSVEKLQKAIDYLKNNRFNK